MAPPSPPLTEDGLLASARAIAGLTLGAVAARLGWPLPVETRRAKGWAGNLIETALGAGQSSRPGPDFERLGVELKTVPVDGQGRPRESTFITTIALADAGRARWEDSAVRKKLARVLWLPVEAEPSVEPADRRIGQPLLWSPSAEEEAVLRADWEDLIEVIAAGYVETLTAHRGRFIQVRPKAANARERTWAVDPDGAPISTLPRGFYLRRSFTTRLLRP